MPPPNYLPSNYGGAMDQSSYFAGLDRFAPVYLPANANEGLSESGIAISDMGLTTEPWKNQLQSLQAKIMSGASKIEFEFAGKGKGSGQGSTPEMYGREEREMMRKLAELNKITTSTHATFTVSGLAGVHQRGFSAQAQQETVHEVQRAIDFAKDATTGGAIVVHTGEWNRPVHHYYGQDDGKPKFEMYPGEREEAQLLVADQETGAFVQDIKKDQTVIIPEWHTAASLGEELGKTFVGKGFDVDGNPVDIAPDDFVNYDGRKLDPKKVEELFQRVPVYDEKNAKFKTREMKWGDIVTETQWYNDKYGTELEPEVYYAQTQIDNQILQSKGSSTFYLRGYQDHRREYEAANKLIDYYKKLSEDPTLSEDDRRQLLRKQRPFFGHLGQFAPPEDVDVISYLEEIKEQTGLAMKHTHEASSAADARAAELERTRRNLKTVKEVGLKRTADALGRLAEEAMDKSAAARRARGPNERFEDLYIAPENWHPAQYGSHPDELLEIVRSGRESFKERLRNTRGITDERRLQELAEKHIKTTFDIGHLNMWRSMMLRKPQESEEAFQKRFTNWVTDHLEQLHKEKAIGHVHVTDNFGYNDEHVAIGQGNAPVKEFVQWMKDRGYRDFIVEAGAYNGDTIMHDAWSYLGVVPWKHRAGPNMMGLHHAHAGWYAPPNYMVGAYVPGNEWVLWSGVQLE